MCVERRWICPLALGLIAIVGLAAATALAQGVSVSPNCGTASNRFFLSTFGWPVPGDQERCTNYYTLTIDDHIVYAVGGRPGDLRSGFSIDLGALTCFECGNLRSPGHHTVRVDGGYGCQSGGEYFTCVATTYDVVASGVVGNPWSLTRSGPFPGRPDTSIVLFRFLPQSSCGFPECDSVQLIQVVRVTGLDRHGNTRILTEAEQGIPVADSLDAWTTADHRHIDVAPSANSPYLTIGYPYFGSKSGRSGTVLDTARVLDVPTRPDSAYPDTIVRIVLDLEINALCGAGTGTG